MSLISVSQAQDGVTGVNAASINTPINTIVNDYNGNITDANIASNAAIAGSKIAYQTVSNPYKFSAYRNAAWNTGTGSQFNLVTFDTKTFDTGTNYDTSTGKFTAPVAGFYLFAATVGTLTSNIWLQIALYKNGSVAKHGNGVLNASGSINSYNVVTALLQLAATDYVQVYMYANSSTQGGLTGADGTFFDGYLVSAT